MYCYHIGSNVSWKWPQKKIFVKQTCPWYNHAMLMVWCFTRTLDNISNSIPECFENDLLPVMNTLDKGNYVSNRYSFTHGECEILGVICLLSGHSPLTCAYGPDCTSGTQCHDVTHPNGVHGEYKWTRLLSDANHISIRVFIGRSSFNFLP